MYLFIFFKVKYTIYLNLWHIYRQTLSLTLSNIRLFVCLSIFMAVINPEIKDNISFHICQLM